MSRRTVEISLTLYSSVILSGSILELYANPVARSETGVTDELYCCFDAGWNLDRLPDLEVGELGHYTGKPWQ